MQNSLEQQRKTILSGLSVSCKIKIKRFRFQIQLPHILCISILKCIPTRHDSNVVNVGNIFIENSD